MIALFLLRYYNKITSKISITFFISASFLKKKKKSKVMIFPDLKWGYVGDRVRMRALISDNWLFRNSDD